MLGWWQFWEGHFSTRTCDHLIEAGLKVKAEQAVVGFGKKVRDDQELRRSQVRWVKPYTKGFEMLWNRLTEIIDDANTNAFGFDLYRLKEMQFTEYRADNSGHYGWHEDLCWVPRPAVKYHRKLSLVMQLSDPSDYDGGNLELSEEPPEASKLRRRGSVIIFPSFLKHRVTPITRGTRYSLVAWVDGPQFR